MWNVECEMWNYTLVISHYTLRRSRAHYTLHIAAQPRTLFSPAVCFVFVEGKQGLARLLLFLEMGLVLGEV